MRNENIFHIAPGQVAINIIFQFYKLLVLTKIILFPSEKHKVDYFKWVSKIALITRNLPFLTFFQSAIKESSLILGTTVRVVVFSSQSIRLRIILYISDEIFIKFNGFNALIYFNAIYFYRLVWIHRFAKVKRDIHFWFYNLSEMKKWHAD